MNAPIMTQTTWNGGESMLILLFSKIQLKLLQVNWIIYCYCCNDKQPFELNKGGGKDLVLAFRLFGIFVMVLNVVAYMYVVI